MVCRSSNYRLNDAERDFVFSLIQRFTGTCQEGSYRREVLATNVERRIRYVGAPSLRAYLSFALQDETEEELLISALTIHTTSWFREFPHFQKLEETVRQRIADHKLRSIRVLCAGCSTGEEAYSIALTLEKIRGDVPGFEYRVEGIDIDPLSIATASRGLYGEIAFSLIPEEYRTYCVVGTGSRQGLFAPNKEVRSRCSFSVRDLRTLSTGEGYSFDCIFCRNVLIYFKLEDVTSLVKKLLGALHVDGALFLGHSEAIDAQAYGLRFLGESTYIKRDSFQPPRCADIPGRALVARTPGPQERPDVIVVGASTGGTEAVMRLLEAMPAHSPPIVVVQHIAPYFARAFAQRIAQNASLRLGVCAEATLLAPGHVYFADDDRHIGIGGRSGGLAIIRSDGAPINRHRPSVDFLFKSAALLSNVKVAAVLLTGMGSDGAVGMKELHDRGAMTFCQDERSCVVFGMPREAIALGAADVIANPTEIRQQLRRMIGQGGGAAVVPEGPSPDGPGMFRSIELNRDGGREP